MRLRWTTAIALLLLSAMPLAGTETAEDPAVARATRFLDPQDPVLLRALHTAAQWYFEQGNYAEAARLFERQLELSKKVFGAEDPWTLTAMEWLAAMLGKTGDYSKAKLIEEEVLEVQRRIFGDEHPDTLTALHNLAGILHAQGDLVGAQERYEQVLEARRRILGNEHPNTLTALHNLALNLKAQGDLGGARQRYEQVLEAQRRILGDEHPDTLTTLANLAETLKALGDLVEARQREEEVLEVRRRILGDEHPDTLIALSYLARTLEAQGDLVGARQGYEQVLESFRRILGDERPDTLFALGNLAEILKAQGDLVGARQRYEDVLEALRRFLGNEHPATLATLNNLAITLKAQGDVAGARQCYEEVLEARRRISGEEHPETLLVMFNLGLALKALGLVDQAQKLWERVVEIRAKNRNDASPDSLEEARPAFELADIHRDAGRLEEASRLFNAALDALEGQADRFDLSEETKSRFRSYYRNAYHATIDVALRRNRVDDAFYTLEKYRAQSLLTLLRWGQPPTAEPTVNGFARDEIARRSDKLLYQLDQLDPEADRDRWFALLAERSQLQRQREALWYRRMQGRRDGQKLTVLHVDEFRAHLDSETLLLAYHVTDDGTNLFTMTRDGLLEVHQLPVTAPELWLQVGRYFPLLLPATEAAESDSPEEEAEETSDAVDLDARINLGRWLYDQLLAKAGDRIAGKQRLLILPDGPLYYLPFGALIRPALKDPRGWQYLVEWKPIHTVQSATVYAELQQWRPAKQATETPPKLVALGNPSYPPTPSEDRPKTGKQPASWQAPFTVRSTVDRGLFDGLLPLPNTAREVEGIASLFPEGHARSYSGSEATEDRAKQELTTARYVHFAAHGLADPENPLDSFLALTIPEKWSPDRNNGILQAWEVIDHLRLDADLVVLSACATAFGPELGGEGLMSLARAFQIAGARTVAASLWSVADESTAELMIRFYRHLIQDGMPKDEALRAAQMELIRGPIEVTLEDGTVVERDFSAPYHWAAFQLIGDWQ